MTRGGKCIVTREWLEANLKDAKAIPDDAIVLKVSHSTSPVAEFDVLWLSPKGMEIAEGADFPFISRSDLESPWWS